MRSAGQSLAVSTPNTTASSAQTKRPELKPILACACSSRYRRQPPIQRFPRLLACPDGPEQKAKRQGQRQSRVGPLLQRLVDRNGHVVADLADRLDCFPSLVLGVRDDTSDIRTCRHGSILSYAVVCCKTKCGHKSSAFCTCMRTYAARTARCRSRCERASARWHCKANDLFGFQPSCVKRSYAF